MKVIKAISLTLWFPCLLAWPQGQPNKTEITQIRGKIMGFSSVSPALQKEVEAKNGKKPAPDLQSKGPNSSVNKHGFAYVSPKAERGNK